MGRRREADQVSLKDPFGVRMILIGSPTAEPFSSYSDEELKAGWQTYGPELLKDHDPEELWGWHRFGMPGES